MNVTLLSGAASRSSRRWLLAAAAGVLAFGTAQGQALNYAPAGASITTSTYTDLGTNGGAITTANFDDANSGAQIIPFSFSYNGQTFNQYTINTNGILKLGSTALASTTAYSAGTQDYTGGPLNDAAETNVLFPFNLDLLGSAALGTEYRSVVSGTAPNRVLTVQWKNVSDKARASSATVPTIIDSQYSTFSFQVKLYETTNVIEFVYGAATANAAATDNFKYATVGIKGSGSATNQAITVTKGSTQAWSLATFLTGDYSTGIGNAFNFRKSVLPTAGTTLRFTAAVANDASVGSIFTLTKQPVPSGTPHIVRATVSNTGTATMTSRIATLTISGANSFTTTQIVPALAVGGSTVVTFAAYTSTATGTNNVTVSVPADDNSSNNSQTETQAVNTTTYSYANAVLPTSARGFGASTTLTSAFLAKFTTNTSLSITQVRAYMVDFVGAGTPGSTIGKTVYGVLIDPATGTVLGRSADFVVTAANIDNYTTFTLTTPVTVPAGDFMVGLAQTYQTGQTTQYFPIGTQPEANGRTATFYTTSITTPTAPLDAAAVAPAAAYRFMIEAVAAPASTCAPATALTLTAVSPTSIRAAFTASASATSYTVTYQAGTGAVQTVTPNPTASPVTISGLSPNTAYTIRVVSNCTAGGTSLATAATLSTPLSTRNEALAATLSLYPNPAHSAFTLSVPAGTTLRNVQATLSNALGQTVQTRQLVLSAAASTTEFNVSGLAAGVYSLQLKSGNETTVKRVVVE